MTRAADTSLSCDHATAVDFGFVELTWLQIAVLGIVQGITELLPISSTAHLRVIPGILGWRDPGSAFSAAMQLASFVAVIVYFRKDLLALGRGSWRAAVSRDSSSTDLRIVVGIILGTIPLAIAGLVLRPVLNGCHSPLRGLLVVGLASIVMAVLLGVAERFARHRRTFAQLTLMDGVIVGIAQAFALIPGVSRSGATLTAGLFCGMERETAARFSFLLGLPAVTLAGLFELRVLFKAGLGSDGWATLFIGLAFASVTAFIAIYALLHYLERRSAWIFVWYRLVFGIFIVAGIAGGYLHE
ncbi:MAG: undecaprenyl-diphosphate phosphatase [Pseudomonadota bacterium]|nr:undecaprenyl-diphosphate phosphatase [Pseudomonadota bacterium]